MSWLYPSWRFSSKRPAEQAFSNATSTGQGEVRSLQTLAERRGIPQPERLDTDVPDTPYWIRYGDSERADHAEYPNPHNYIVRVADEPPPGRAGCRCARNVTYDPVTNQGEVLCKCGQNPFPPGDYAGESTDRNKLYMEDDLRPSRVVLL